MQSKHETEKSEHLHFKLYTGQKEVNATQEQKVS
jgi:hypothetical protein